MIENLRDAVVAEARRWIGTPYRHNARVRGSGVDCGQLPLAVYAAVGLIPELPITHMAPQVHLNTEYTGYLDLVQRHALEIDGNPGVGDFVMFKVARAWHHGGIVTRWPLVIHANSEAARVIEDDAARTPFARVLLIDRHPRFFTLPDFA